MSAPQEIERKFLVAAMPDLTAARRASLRQGYVTRPEDSIELRLRQSDATFVLCVKAGEGIVRSEREIALDAAQFDHLWPQTEGRRIEKVRWTGPLDHDLSFELDLFSGDLAPLALVEVEFTSRAQAEAFDPPAWFGPEVSDDPRFRNKALALSGGAYPGRPAR